MESIDIKSKGEYPANALLNCAEYHFVFDGIECASMEGFLQSLKIRDVEEQRQVCKMVGIDAKLWGSQHSEWREDQTLYWLGKKYYRHGDAYYSLLERAYLECFDENKDFQEALLATGGKQLTHSIGKSDPCDTILTEDEFCLLLTNLRSVYVKDRERRQLFILFVLGLIVGLCLYFYIGPSLMTFFAVIGTNAFVAAIYCGCKLYRHCMKLEKM